MKSVPFVPSVREISASEAERIPGFEAAVSYWTGCSTDEWIESVTEHWGNAAYVMCRGDEVLGFTVYGPQEYLPNVRRFPVGNLENEAGFLAYVGGDDRVRRHLLVRVLRDLKSRKVGKVEAVASDLGARWHVPTRFLLESGWRPVRQGWKGGVSYTLVCTDLGNTVEVGELARGLIGRVKLPRLRRSPDPAPGAYVQSVSTAKELIVEGQRS